MEVAQTGPKLSLSGSRRRISDSRTASASFFVPAVLFLLREMREPLPGGWLVATNLNNVLKRTIIRLAAEVAGLTFGKDVIVDF
jgi:hypothetical protein